MIAIVLGMAVAAVTAAAVHRVLLWSPALGAFAPGYPAWWYGLSRGRRAVVLLVMPVSGALCGLAWEASPEAAGGAIIILVTATAVSRTVRAATRKNGR